MHLIAVAVLTPAMDATPEPPIRDNPYLSCRHIHTHAINHHTAIGYKDTKKFLPAFPSPQFFSQIVDNAVKRPSRTPPPRHQRQYKKNPHAVARGLPV